MCRRQLGKLKLGRDNILPLRLTIIRVFTILNHKKAIVPIKDKLVQDTYEKN